MPSAGYKKVAIQLQHANHVKILPDHNNPKGDTTCRADNNGDTIWLKRVDPQIQAKKKALGIKH